jgi:hypothetical protein
VPEIARYISNKGYLRTLLSFNDTFITRGNDVFEGRRPLNDNTAKDILKGYSAKSAFRLFTLIDLVRRNSMCHCLLSWWYTTLEPGYIGATLCRTMGSERIRSESVPNP